MKILILSMKNDNVLWGVKRIQGELLKLDISLSTKKIRRILQSFRRQGKIRRSLTWKKFLETQIQSIYAMDFLTVDTMLGERFYVFAVISHQTREIVRFAITENPTGEFVRQQIPKPSVAERTAGPIRKSAVLGGLHHHYFRQAA